MREENQESIASTITLNMEGITGPSWRGIIKIKGMYEVVHLDGYEFVKVNEVFVK